MQDIQFLLNLIASGANGSTAPRVQGLEDSGTGVRAILPASSVLPSSVPIHGLTELGLRSYPSGLFVITNLQTVMF